MKDYKLCHEVKTISKVHYMSNELLKKIHILDKRNWMLNTTFDKHLNVMYRKLIITLVVQQINESLVAFIVMSYKSPAL